MTLSLRSWTWGCALFAAASLAYGETLPESLKRCAVEKDKEVRLACYDEVAAIAAGPAAAPASPEQQFGVKGELLRKQREAEEKAKERAPELQGLVATITKIRELPKGQLVVDLDNGQRWEQKEVKNAFLLREGDQVKIEAGSLGSFWLVTDSGRRTRVKRVR